MRVSASSAAEQQLFLRHLPRFRHSVSSHCQPLHSSPLTSISHFIMSHHNSRRLAGSALLGVPWCSLALLAGLGVSRRYRWSEISTFTDLSIACSIVRRFRSVGSRNMQPSMATSRRRWRSHGVGKATPSHYIDRILLIVISISCDLAYYQPKYTVERPKERINGAYLSKK